MPRFLWQQVAGLARTQSCAPKCELLLDCGAFSPETQVEVAMNRKRCKTQAKKFRCHEEGNIQVAMDARSPYRRSTLLPRDHANHFDEAGD